MKLMSIAICFVAAVFVFPSAAHAAGVRCGVAHSLGSRALSTPAPAVPDITAGKAMHNAYQQRSAASQIVLIWAFG